MHSEKAFRVMLHKKEDIINREGAGASGKVPLVSFHQTDKTAG